MKIQLKNIILKVINSIVYTLNLNNIILIRYSYPKRKKIIMIVFKRLKIRYEFKL